VRRSFRQFDAYSRALAGGYLGVAAAAARRKNYQTLMRLQPDQWYHARMSVRVLKLNGRLIGLFVVGPHWHLWRMMDARMASQTAPLDEMSPGFIDFMVTVLSLAKLHVVAVPSDHRGCGHGSRLVNATLRIGREDGLNMLYGQFTADRPGLRQFYASLGFDVLGGRTAEFGPGHRPTQRRDECGPG
jgi:GNAT superfamily N-acetyltransferase